MTGLGWVRPHALKNGKRELKDSMLFWCLKTLQPVPMDSWQSNAFFCLQLLDTDKVKLGNCAGCGDRFLWPQHHWRLNQDCRFEYNMPKLSTSWNPTSKMCKWKRTNCWKAKYKELMSAVYVFYLPSTQEAEAAGLLYTRPAWAIKWSQGHPELHRESQSQKDENKIKAKNGWSSWAWKCLIQFWVSSKTKK